MGFNDQEMSSRQLRKLQKQREEARQPAVAEEEDSSEADEPRQGAKPSLFASLAIDDEDEEEEEEDAHAVVEVDQKSQENIAQPAKAKRKSKKGKKKGKASADDTKDATKNSQVDDIDAALLELQASTKTSLQDVPTPVIDADYERICRLLGVATQHLKVANEMRNLFGKAAAATSSRNEADAGAARAARRRGHDEQVDLETALKGHHAPGKGLPELTLRRNPLIQGKSEWPKGTTGGLTMELVDDQTTRDGTMEFRFVHDRAYQEVQKQFAMFVQMGEPSNLIGLLMRNRKSAVSR